jgi:hypothetical protein
LALVAAQLVEDEATYDPLLRQNIDAGQYSEDLLEKAMVLLTALDERAATVSLTAASGALSMNNSSTPTPLPPVPLSVSQALGSLEWEAWMNVTAMELTSLKEMSVWHTPLIPFRDIPKQKIIPSKIIYARKYNADGTTMCSRGSIAAEENYEIYCVDVETVFLHSPIPSDQTICMHRPVGLTDNDMPEIVELDKCTYGLPQASNRFREHSDGVLRGIVFVPTISDPCVYVMYKDGG